MRIEKCKFVECCNSIVQIMDDYLETAEEVAVQFDISEGEELLPIETSIMCSIENLLPSVYDMVSSCANNEFVKTVCGLHGIFCSSGGAESMMDYVATIIKSESWVSLMGECKTHGDFYDLVESFENMDDKIVHFLMGV